MPPISSSLAGWARRFGNLAHSNLRLAAILYTLRLAIKPYCGLMHDAQLYAFQVLNKAEAGRYSHDLFFAFGSQDQFTLFSGLLGPLARYVPIATLFLGFYFLLTFLFIWGEVALLRLLIRGPVLRICATSLLVLSDLNYGKQFTFFVHEAFLTARLPAQVCVLWALVDLLRGPRGSFVPLLLISMLLHPLMGISGVCVAAGYGLTHWSRRYAPAMIATGCIGLLIVLMLLGLPGVGEVLGLKKIDGQWREVALGLSPFCYFSAWVPGDGLRNWGALTLCVVGLLGLAPSQKRLAWMIILLGLMSLAVTILAEWTRLAILLQGQAYRGLWLLKLLSIPLGLSGARYFLRRRSAERLLGWIVATYVLVSVDIRQPLGLSIILVGIIWFGLGLRALLGRRQPTVGPPRFPWPGLASRTLEWGRPMVACCVGFVLTAGLAASFSDIQSVWVTHPDWETRLFCMPKFWPIAAVWFAALGVLYLLGEGHAKLRGLASGRTLAVLVSVVVSWNTLLVAWCSRPSSQHARLGRPSTEFIRQVIASNSPPGSVPVVYWPGSVRNIWLDLRACCYHDVFQAPGVIFSHEMALETRRRGSLVGPFEVTAMRHKLPGLTDMREISLLRHCSMADQIPTWSDLERLASDSQLDWIVLPYPLVSSEDPSEGTLGPEFTDGHVFIYDCRKLRAAHSSRVHAG